MKLRDLSKMLVPNDGTRTLMESIMIPEIAHSLEAIRDAGANGVLIGGAALSHWVKPRMTQDLDLLFLSDQDIPEEIHGFKKTRGHSFQNMKTHVEVEVLSPEFLRIDPELVKAVIQTAITSDGIKVASPSGLVALKLYRFSFQDQADIVALLQTDQVNLSPFEGHLSELARERYQELLARMNNPD